MKKYPKILITPGDPSGIGYDIAIHIAKKKFPAKIINVANIDLLEKRAKALNEKVNFINVNLYDDDLPLDTNKNILVHNIKNNKEIKIGCPSVKNAPMIIESLNIAIEACIRKKSDALVTGPVQKNILMEYGEKFSGHTEYIATKTGGTPIMMLHSNNLKIALLTTHVPLKEVSKLITKERIESYVRIINNDLKKKFGIKKPKISICGLNPHAGEDGYIGKEEKEIICPAIKSLKKSGYNVNGPYSADTIFTRNDSDLILAMYHDQALPVIKTIEFGNIVNTTLGLPIIRTSVDHGTAIDIAGTGKADPKSLIAAIKTSIEIAKQTNGK